MIAPNLATPSLRITSGPKMETCAVLVIISHDLGLQDLCFVTMLALRRFFGAGIASIGRASRTHNYGGQKKRSAHNQEYLA